MKKTLRCASFLFAAAIAGCNGDDSKPSPSSPIADAQPSPPKDAAEPLDASSPTGDASVQDASTWDGGTKDASELDASPSDDAGPTPDAPIGPFLDAAPGCPPEPVQAICTRLGANCGTLTTLDVCGVSRTVACGVCPSGSVCGGGPAPNVCAGCTPEPDGAFCGRNRAQCGTISATDNCGAMRTVNCGACRRGEVCGANNLCSCTPETDAAFCTRMTADCGTLTANDNCGAPRTASCGACRRGSTCGGDGIPNRCQVLRVCEPPTLPPTLGLTPFVTTPAPFSQARCTASQATAFIDACLAMSSSASTCTAWRNANATCGTCVLTPGTSAAWGPIVTDPSAVSSSNPYGITNRSGTDGSMACLDHYRSGCGFAFTKHEACLLASCDPREGCNGASSSVIAACRATAKTTSCAATYAAAYDPTTGACRGVLSTSLTSGSGDVCVLPVDQRTNPTEAQMRTFVTNLIQTFCGP